MKVKYNNEVDLMPEQIAEALSKSNTEEFVDFWNAWSKLTPIDKQEEIIKSWTATDFNRVKNSFKDFIKLLDYHELKNK